jgi:hypothetical protein
MPGPCEILPPEPWREGALIPQAIDIGYEPLWYRTVVRFEDGGVWGIEDRQLGYIDRDDLGPNIGEIFARWPERFHFIHRARGGYAWRGR